MFDIIKKALDSQPSATIHFQSGNVISISEVRSEFFDDEAITAVSIDGKTRYILNLSEIEYVSF